MHTVMVQVIYDVHSFARVAKGILSIKQTLNIFSINTKSGSYPTVVALGPFTSIISIAGLKELSDLDILVDRTENVSRTGTFNMEF